MLLVSNEKDGYSSIARNKLRLKINQSKNNIAYNQKKNIQKPSLLLFIAYMNTAV